MRVRCRGRLGPYALTAAEHLSFLVKLRQKFIQFIQIISINYRTSDDVAEVDKHCSCPEQVDLHQHLRIIASPRLQATSFGKNGVVLAEELLGIQVHKRYGLGLGLSIKN